MPGESVLIVDDAPVNLKLADILLRKEGFRVQTARDATEALSALGAFQPDLMLVSARLPGMDGLELARCVKSDPDTRHIVVVAIILSSSPAEREQALEAGCAGFITRPFDPQKLGSQIRSYLERRPRTSGDAQTGFELEWLGLTGPELDTVRRRFLQTAGGQAREMLDTAGAPIDALKVSALLRRWGAVATALGYPAVAETARATDEFLAQGKPSPAQWRGILSDLLVALSEPPEAALEPLPDPVMKALAGKRIALVSFDPDDADRLCAALDRVGARPRLFEASDFPDFGPVKDCSLVMVRVRRETLGSLWLAIDSPAPPGQPLLLVGGRADISELSPEEQARAREFLIDGWQAEEALMRCCFALTRVAPPAAPVAPAAPAAAISAPATAPKAAAPPPRLGRADVLIADDDPIVRSLLRGTLENYGMSCRMASSGPEALELIRQKLPDAAVLDINMPGMDGYLVLANIREQGLPLPVLLLTARCHENDISRGFTLGADDYLIKPFNNVELIARLKRLMRR